MSQQAGALARIRARLGPPCSGRSRQESRCAGQVYEPARYMSVAEAVAQLLEVEAAEGGGAYGPGTLAVGVARLGSPDQRVRRAPGLV